MHGIERILAYELVHLIETAERSADADHLNIDVDFREPFDFFKLLGEKLLDFRRLFFGRNAVVVEKIGERNGAEWQSRIV